ncbi:hypothetical protein PINS_up016964 [Pythium insidiosum]|nr:hypothetical protein PINS_up016964 [Pythium insidiosum]
MGDSCAELCAGSALFVFNGVDIICGTALTVYALYLVPILVVGGVMILMAAMSWCGASYHSCAPCLSLSSHLLIILALMELVLAIVIFTQGPAINRFLASHQADLKLTDERATTLRGKQFAPA